MAWRGWLVAGLALLLPAVSLARERPSVAVFEVEVSGAPLAQVASEALPDSIGKLIAAWG